ncbi:hypothetical protein TMatcc_004672 [Talaromyces marneffei ATCC 18224]|uniref:Uncharacterized protein n=2 Tax=Talaromyces marneffei TaxID=37727 RepID=B6Q3E2_TALMQ|nr:uncharacterized protein EYB26_000398 [Talaromyces marneffei]EEA27048.1 conserved hypothetical protein [Talaromyces marneffei ATCC 18224]QGA12753.1 hypothetical protein EYB26_000398 [Talaromyces marneffei]
MPKTSSQSPKRSPLAMGKYRRSELSQLTSARNKGLKHPAGKKTVTTKSLNRKRKPSFSSISTISSVSGFEDDDEQDEADSEASSDEEDESARRTPSYGGKSRRGPKTGSKMKSSTLSTIKKRKLSYDEGYEGQQSSAGDSDSDYAAVDEIDDDEDMDVEKLEEQMILESEEDSQMMKSTFSTSDAPDLDVWEGFGSFDDHILFSTEPLLEDNLYSAMETFGETDFTSEAVETPVQRHVHFVVEEDDDADSDSSSDSRDGSTDDEIPGDFLQQDSLDPTLRRMIDSDYDPSNNQRYEEIFGESDISHPANIYHVESDAVSDGSSGYETDDGETTDEDLPPPATITHPRSILRRDSTTSLTTTGDSTSQRSNPPRRRGPIMGTFVADPKKPVALVDCTGKHLVIIPAYASSRHDWLESATNSMCGTAHNSPRTTTMHLVDESDTDALTSPNGFELNPMLSSGNLMMTALGNDATPGGQVMGPPEAFYPSQSYGGDSSYDEDDEDDERMLNVDDFIDFGNGSSDEEDEGMNKGSDDDEGLTNSPAVVSNMQGLTTPTPNRANGNDNDSAERFLNHLDKGIVTAFRRNHTRYQTLIRLPQHREFMPANSPSRAASVFKHSRYADPRTPPRKRKSSQYSGGEAVRRKLIDGHQRNQLSF